MEKIIDEGLKIIREHKEKWEKTYDNYANTFIKNKDLITKLSKTVKEYPPLRLYISTTKIKEAKTSLVLDVRYRGQSVATLTVKDKEITISTKDKDANNKSHFECNIKLDHKRKINWKSEDADAFRQFFNNMPPRNKDGKGNEEHNIEHLLLTEFSKESGKVKHIKGIQPVKFCGIRYPMPTPISASKPKEHLRYSGQRGGSIDILARTGRGKNGRLTVIEVKDENNKSEAPKYALKQAIQYAVFVRELLRSKGGKEWYRIFGFGKDIPKSLTIRVACAMPDGVLDTSFARETYFIDNDILECHYIYFKYNDEKMEISDTSLSDAGKGKKY